MEGSFGRAVEATAPNCKAGHPQQADRIVELFVMQIVVAIHYNADVDTNDCVIALSSQGNQPWPTHYDIGVHYGSYHARSLKRDSV